MQKECTYPNKEMIAAWCQFSRIVLLAAVHPSSQFDFVLMRKSSGKTGTVNVIPHGL